MQQTIQTASSAVTLLQFYPVLAAVGGLLFWAGVLSARLAEALRRLAKIEAKQEQATAEAIQIGVMSASLAKMEASQEKTAREIAGIHRSLANIASGNVGMITKFEHEG